MNVRNNQNNSHKLKPTTLLLSLPRVSQQMESVKNVLGLMAPLQQMCVLALKTCLKSKLKLVVQVKKKLLFSHKVPIEDNSLAERHSR